MRGNRARYALAVSEAAGINSSGRYERRLRHVGLPRWAEDSSKQGRAAEGVTCISICGYFATISPRRWTLSFRHLFSPPHSYHHRIALSHPPVDRFVSSAPRVSVTLFRYFVAASSPSRVVRRCSSMKNSYSGRVTRAPPIKNKSSERSRISTRPMRPKAISRCFRAISDIAYIVDFIISLPF